ncbi:Panacea domain-containing protein [Acidipropionibacterium jensenii]|uniref:Panacea domain-containing protein n=1 Tax=Acidipropionibacterium jensenii TaxID=1749 RepID=UPI00214B35D4|nr:type II toxin-antitoxin system antitoxin SocA domain-containing protein [Acidipropionibacterium jensenii]
MATILDVSAHILDKQGPMSASTLQKLCYYAQAWQLVWEGRPLFDEEFQAWASGPVCPQLYEAHRGTFTVTEEPGGDQDRLDPDEVESIDVVLEHYAGMSAYQLGALVRSESPWRTARGDLAPGVRGEAHIPEVLAAEYYESLLAGHDDQPSAGESCEELTEAQPDRSPRMTPHASSGADTVETLLTELDACQFTPGTFMDLADLMWRHGFRTDGRTIPARMGYLSIDETEGVVSFVPRGHAAELPGGPGLRTLEPLEP